VKQAGRAAHTSIPKAKYTAEQMDKIDADVAPKRARRPAAPTGRT
jgi:hypothetical protein